MKTVNELKKLSIKWNDGRDTFVIESIVAALCEITEHIEAQERPDVTVHVRPSEKLSKEIERAAMIRALEWECGECERDDGTCTIREVCRTRIAIDRLRNGGDL